MLIILTRRLVLPGKEGDFAKSCQRQRATGKPGFLNEITKMGISAMPAALRSVPPACKHFVAYLSVAMWTTEECFHASGRDATPDVAVDAEDPLRIVVDLG